MGQNYVSKYAKMETTLRWLPTVILTGDLWLNMASLRMRE